MSMELYVLSDKRLTSIDAWQETIDAEGLPLQLSAGVPLADLHGALPVLLAGRPTAFEYDHLDAGELISDFPDIAFGHQWKCAVSFRWGADLDAGVAAYLASAAYALATKGVILDCQEGKMISPKRGIDVARELERSEPMIELAVRKVMEKFRR